MTDRSTPTDLTFTELLEQLHRPDEHTALCHKTGDGPFSTIVNTPALIALAAHGLPDADVWFSINPIAGPPRVGPRGDANAIPRLAAMWADLDVKPGACATLDDAHALIDDLSTALGTRPAAIIHSGHGLQPLWPIDDPHAELTDNDQRAEITGLLKRWGRLVTTIAGRRGIAVDNVFDLPRILRAPGTTNHKGTPVPTRAVADTGGPVTLEQIADTLDAYGIEALTIDATLDEPVDTSTWTWSDTTCVYTVRMIEAWATDAPSARHPWLLAQATRLACVHRMGCITDGDHRRGIDTLTDRMQQLCAAGSTARAVAPSEVTDALRWGQARAAAMTDRQLARELGDHKHTPELVVIDGDRIADLAAATQASTAPILAPAREPLQTPRTDLGNARQLVHLRGHTLRYSPSRSSWLTWTGQRWQISEDDAPAIEAAVLVAESLPHTSDVEQAWKRKSANRSGLENMVAIARRDRRVRVTADHLDAHPMLLNTPSGTVDLTTGAQRPHAPAEHHTKITAVGYDPAMSTPRWDRFLTDTFGGNVDLIDYLQRIIGYACTGRVTHHILPFLHGAGANGKSVLTSVITRLLGDYAITLPANVLIAAKYGHDSELARLAGARLATCSELPEDGRFDEQKIKMLTGGDRITARFLYSNPFEFTPSHTLILSGNHQPTVKMGGNSFWRRLRLIPFEHIVPENARIDGLDDILIRDEGPGILAWMIEGAAAAMGGLRDPQSVLDATAGYEAEEDSFGQFVEDCLHLAPGSQMVKIEGTKLRGAYASWCRANGISEVSAQAFGREMRRRTGAPVRAIHGKRWYLGVTLIDTESDDSRYGE